MISLQNSNPKILVIGDLMIDHYLWGSCERISPEAPVPVINISSESAVLGGAGNVVNNLINRNQSSGSKSIQWDATNNQGEPVSAGVYLYKIQAGDFSQTKKMILLK